MRLAWAVFLTTGKIIIRMDFVLILGKLDCQFFRDVMVRLSNRSWERKSERKIFWAANMWVRVLSPNVVFHRPLYPLRKPRDSRDSHIRGAKYRPFVRNWTDAVHGHLFAFRFFLSHWVTDIEMYHFWCQEILIIQQLDWTPRKF
jgi:hypothetical protein